MTVHAARRGTLQGHWLQVKRQQQAMALSYYARSMAVQAAMHRYTVLAAARMAAPMLGLALSRSAITHA